MERWSAYQVLVVVGLLFLNLAAYGVLGPLHT